MAPNRSLEGSATVKNHRHLFFAFGLQIGATAIGGLFSTDSSAKSPKPQVFSHGFNLKAADFETDESSSPTHYRSLNFTAPEADLGAEVDMQTHLMRVLRNNRLDKTVGLKRAPGQKLNLFQQSSFFSDSYQFVIDGIDICLHEIKTHQTLAGRHVIFGSIPDATAGSYDLDSWPNIYDSLELASLAILGENLSSDIELLNKKSCLWANEDKSLSPVWDMKIRFGDVSFRVFVDDQKVFDMTKLAFHVDGTASIFPSNPLDTGRETFALTGLKGNGTLENSYFKIEVDTNSGNSTAYAANHNFSFGENEPEFVQASLFTNANRMLYWLKQKGFDRFGSSQIAIKAHRIFQPGSFEDKNNATYEPVGSGGGPTISVGDGDGRILQNLGLDADVVNHELGHHVIYQSVNYLSGESLVIHEALADFLVFARTNDSCLGESICPENSGACAIHATCLRTAENSLRLDSQNLPAQAHIRSQFFSGFLWDLYEKDNIPIEDVVTMVIDGIVLLVSNSGYQHVLFSLLMVDDADFDGKYCSLILNRARERGMESLVSDVTCENLAALLDKYDSEGETDLNTEKIVDSFTANNDSTTQKRKSSKSWCGSIGANSGSAGTFSFLIYILAPFLLLVRRRFLP